VNPGTTTLNADLFGDEEAGVRLLNREGKNPKSSCEDFWKLKG